MRKRIFTSTIAALALFTFVGLVAALAIAWPNLARAHSPGSATLTALTVTAGTAAQTLSPTFSSTVTDYTVYVDNSVAQVTVTGTPDGDGTVTYQYTDAASGTDGHQVNLPTLGGKRVNVVVRHRDGGTTTTQTYTVLVIREGTVATDTIALMALYNSTDGANWTTNTNWGTTEPIGTWFGVFINTDGRVTTLYLLNNNLNGTMPASLGNLTRLQQLDLSGNQLSGRIPTSLGNLTSLTTLSLWGNQLSGTLPDSLGTLTSLQYLYLSYNQLRGTLPDSLSNLAGLLQLSLGDNQLHGTLPAWLGNLSNLTFLDVGINNFDGPLPAELGNLSNLTRLAVGINNFDGPIPAELGNLSNLTNLHMSRNNFDGQIPDLSRLTSLQYLYLWDNQLSGTIPNLSSLTNLKELYLNRNLLSGEIPATLNSLTNLTHLYLNQNQLSGTIPNLSSLTSLQELSLSSNRLTGSIPDLSSLTRLQGLWLDSNDLTGGIPTWLGSLTTLTSLSLDTNELDGTIPDLSSLVNLTTLNLRNNQLSGTIPASLGQVTSLTHLYLSVNQLSGDFPAALGTLSNLTNARFASNKDADGNPSLTGCVPLGLRYLLTAEDYMDRAYDPDRRAKNIRAQDFIAVDANRDGDTDDPDDIPGLGLPFCMVSALAFSDVTLSPAFASATAAYTASVANTVAATTVTATLPDSNDRLSIRKGTNSYTSGGDVPLAVGQNEITITVTPRDGTPTLTYTVTVFREGVDRDTLTALYNSAGGASWTDKASWGTTDPLNEWFGVEADANDNVTALDLSGNNLRGTLPPDLGTLTMLGTLDLSNNRLSRTIPNLSALDSLTSLDLSDNQLSGTIPDWLGSLTGLRDLSLRDNRLTGVIPEELGNLNQLDLLYLDDNRLSGAIPAALGGLSRLQATRFAGNSLAGCVPDGLRGLLIAQPYLDLPAQDFIPDDANTDGDTNDVGDTPGLGLPFCTLQSLTLDGVTLEPAFASDAVVYTASAAHAVTSPTVTATLHNSSDTISIMKGADTYMSGDPVPLDVGRNVITITVTTSDDTPSPHTYTVTVARAPNTPPAFNEALTTTRGVEENTASGENIGDPVAATDDDSDTMTYSLDATSAASFDIDADGQLQTKAALDYETKNSYSVTMSVSDGKDADGNADEMTDNTITVTILVSNVNEAPVFLSAPDSLTIREDTPVGGDIGAPFTATDGDNDTLTYSLDDTGAESFDIDASSGQLRTRVALDFEEGDTSYSLTVTAADPSERVGHRGRSPSPSPTSTKTARSRCRRCSPWLVHSCSPS